ncbi:hypothetical protein [Paracoccus sp. AS002]|uniref:hypothetical protein n=1 Tax=Paracoccus sp. AS002 TaxID=3019545 RepID=UPI0023E7FB47|nr:hypothetical protein [Paracoccus sp. AS002]MDF3907768.1 hypothetical protein [Paracoccus sp. AS002]
MKTHELARALTHLARVLRAGPNIEFDDLTNISTYIPHPKPSRVVREGPEKRDDLEKGTGLALLAEMASYSKQELLELTAQLGIPIEVRKADAVRDVLGKTLKYIQDNPDFRERMVHSATTKGSETRTSSLARALSILMNQP